MRRRLPCTSRVEFGALGVGEARVGLRSGGGILARNRFWLCPALVAIAIAVVPAAGRAAPGEQGCDPLDPAVCLQPWPNDYFTVAGPDHRHRPAPEPPPRSRCRATSPATRSSPDEWNRNDGFSPGQKIVTKVPGLDTPAAFESTGAVPITDIERTYDPDQPIVVINADTRQRHLIWSEIDANPAEPGERQPDHPAGGQLRRGRALHRRAAEPEETRAASRSRPSSRSASTATACRASDPAVEARRPHMESIFRRCGRRASSATTSTSPGTSPSRASATSRERALFIRDDAFAQLGDTNLSDLQVQGTAPQFAVTAGDRLHARAGRTDRAQGRRHLRRPLLPEPAGCPPGARFTYLPGSSRAAADPRQHDGWRTSSA